MLNEKYTKKVAENVEIWEMSCYNLRKEAPTLAKPCPRGAPEGRGSAIFPPPGETMVTNQESAGTSMLIEDHQLYRILGAVPGPAILIRQGAIVFGNAAARALIHPHITRCPPEELLPPELLGEEAAGAETTVTINGEELSATVMDTGEGRLILLTTDPPVRDMAVSLTDAVNLATRNELALYDVSLQAISDMARERSDLATIQHATLLRRSAHRLTHAADNRDRLFRTKMTADPVVTDLPREVGELIGAVNTILEPGRRPIVVENRMTANPLCRVDQGLIMTAILELLSNSLKFTAQEGEIRVILSKSGASAYITVTDQGCGVPADQLSGIFSAYRRRPDVRSYGWGQGMGLGVVQRIMAAHGGAAIFESSQGHGSTVKLSLPSQNVPPDAKPFHRYPENMNEIVLTALSDALPASSFGPISQE